MKIKSLLLLGCALPLLAGAQAQGPSDPAAAVPSTAYRSVFPPVPGAAPATPGDWRRLNADVGQFLNGHMDIIKWEAGQAPGASGLPHGMHGIPPGPGSQAGQRGHEHGSKP